MLMCTCGFLFLCQKSQAADLCCLSVKLGEYCSLYLSYRNRFTHLIKNIYWDFSCCHEKRFDTDNTVLVAYCPHVIRFDQRFSSRKSHRTVLNGFNVIVMHSMTLFVLA